MYQNIFEKSIFLITQCDSIIVKNVVLQRKSIDKHKLYWFANLFSNFLILQALSVKSIKIMKFYFSFIKIIL